MKKICFCLLAGLFLLPACNKEEVPVPGKDVNWYQIPDNLPGELCQLRYQVYKENGISIFYNDTIGSETRYNMGGEPYTYYEVLLPGYKIGAGSSKPPITYTYPEEEEDLIRGVKFLRESLFPRVDARYLPVCIMLADKLASGGFEKVAYKDFGAIYVGKIPAIKEMDDRAREVYACDIMGVLYAPYIIKDYPEQLGLFYKKTNGSVQQTKYDSFYQQGISSMFDPWLPSSPYGLGFLTWKAGFYNTMPSQLMDVEMYIALICSSTDKEIEERFADYPVVVEKYYIMKDIMADFKKK